MPPLCRETQSLGQQMLNAPLGINGLTVEPAARKNCFLKAILIKNYTNNFIHKILAFKDLNANIDLYNAYKERFKDLKYKD